MSSAIIIITIYIDKETNTDGIPVPVALQSNYIIHFLFAKNGSKHKSNKEKRRECANNNHSWFQVISRVILSNNRVIT